jgi:hypothetical protein
VTPRVPQKTLLRGAVLAALLGVLAPAPARAQEPPLTLDLHLTAPVGADAVGADLVAGVRPDAGPGFDPGLDARAMPLGALQAWFMDASRPPAAQRLARDFREGAAPETFEIQVETPAGAPEGSVAAGTPVTLAWDPPATAGGVCTGRTLTLVDAALGARVDMTGAQEYAFAAPGPGATRTLALEVGAPGSLSATVPPPPGRLFSPSHGRREVVLVWSPGEGAAGYHVERTDRPGDATPAFTRLTAAPAAGTRYVDADVAGRGAVGYRVVAVSGAGCASAPSDTLVVTP